MTTTNDTAHARTRTLAILARHYQDALEACPHWDYGDDFNDPDYFRDVHDCCYTVDATRRAYRDAKKRAALGGDNR